MKLRNISCSLTDILGADYMEAVQSVATTILGVPEEEANRLANEKIDFFFVGEFIVCVKKNIR